MTIQSDGVRKPRLVSSYQHLEGALLIIQRGVPHKQKTRLIPHLVWATPTTSGRATSIDYSVIERTSNMDSNRPWSSKKSYGDSALAVKVSTGQGVRIQRTPPLYCEDIPRHLCKQSESRVRGAVGNLGQQHLDRIQNNAVVIKWCEMSSIP